MEKILVLFLCLAGPLSASEVSVVLDQAASKVEQTAAAELCRFLSELDSSLQCSLVSRPADHGAQIFIGTATLLKAPLNWAK